MIDLRGVPASQSVYVRGLKENTANGSWINQALEIEMRNGHDVNNLKSEPVASESFGVLRNDL